MKKVHVSKNLFNVILLFISVSIIVYFCIHNNNLLTLINSFGTLNPFWLLAAIVFVGLNWAIDSRIIFDIAQIMYKDKYSLRDSFKVTMVGQYFNSVSPFAIAGQPMQALTLSRQGLPTGVAISILVRKFLIYQTTLTFYSLAVIIFKFSFFTQKFSMFMYLAIVGFFFQSAIVILLFLFYKNRSFTTKLINWFFHLLYKVHLVKNPTENSKKVETQLSFYLNNNKAMDKKRKTTYKLYFLTFIQLTCMFIIPFFIYKAFNNPGFPVIDMISAQSFVTMIAAFTPLPGGSGTCESSFVIIFNIFFADSIIKPAMLLWRFLTYYSCIILGSPFALLENKKQKISINANPSPV